MRYLVTVTPDGRGKVSKHTLHKVSCPVMTRPHNPYNTSRVPLSDIDAEKFRKKAELFAAKWRLCRRCHP